jgi:hypothetical protein
VTIVAAASGLGARLRKARLLHPRGRSFTGELETLGTPGHRWGAALLDVPARRPATVRVSKGLPTPAHWPDVLGLAIRIPDETSATGWSDLLLSSAARPPVLRHMPFPRRHFGGSYGTILAYRAGARRIFLATVPNYRLGDTLDDVGRAAQAGGVRLTIAAASRWGWWKPVAVVRFGAPLDAETDAALAFNAIVHHPADLVPVGRVQEARRAAYLASQRGRGVVPADRVSALSPAGLPGPGRR